MWGREREIERQRETERDREEQREDVLLEDYALLPSRGPVRWAGLSWVVVLASLRFSVCGHL